MLIYSLVFEEGDSCVQRLKVTLALLKVGKSETADACMTDAAIKYLIFFQCFKWLAVVLRMGWID